MQYILTIFIALFTLSAWGQNEFTQETAPIVAEGKLLYQSEMASWYGTDLFLEAYEDKNNIGGYFSYVEKDTSKCIFFSKSEKPQVIGTISFDSTYSVENANVNLTERDFTLTETDLYQVRKATLAELQSNEDGLFKFYQNTRPNIIPLVNGKEKKAYILTGPQESGVVIFGNDYLLTFDENNTLITKKRLHENIIPIEYGKHEEGEEEMTMHTHLPETGHFITATDICTLMLYEKFTGWKTHNVVSKEYLNIWNCETDQLLVIPMSTVKKIQEDQEKRKKKKKK